MVNETMLKRLDAWWRASNYLSAGQLYLLENPLLREPLKPEQIKKKIVGHWGTVPGQNFIYTHLNRIINQYDLNMIYLSGPGHGGNAMVAQDSSDKDGNHPWGVRSDRYRWSLFHRTSVLPCLIPAAWE